MALGAEDAGAVGTFKHMRKNEHEEKLFKAEDERFEVGRSRWLVGWWSFGVTYVSNALTRLCWGSVMLGVGRSHCARLTGGPSKPAILALFPLLTGVRVPPSILPRWTW